MHFADQPGEILERAELRRDVLVAAAVRAWLVAIADRVRHAGLAGLAAHRVVAALARGDADRVDRRKIDHVEAHRLRVVDAREAVAKSRPVVATPLCAPRKKLVPLRKQRALAVDVNLGIAAARVVLRRKRGRQRERLHFAPSVRRGRQALDECREERRIRRRIRTTPRGRSTRTSALPARQNARARTPARACRRGCSRPARATARRRTTARAPSPGRSSCR